MIACRISEATTVRSGSLVGAGQQPVEGAAGEEQRVGLVVGAVDRHADVVQQGAAGDHHLGVAVAHPVVGDHRRLDPGLDQQAQQAQGDVEDDLHVDPGVVRHPQPLGRGPGPCTTRPRTCSSALTASRKLSSLRLPRVGARTLASAIASCGGLRVGPCGSGVGTGSVIGADRREGIGHRLRDGPAQPQTGQGLEPDCAVEQRGTVVLLGLGGGGGVAGPPTDSQVP